MSRPTFLESRAAYVGKRVGVSGTRILAAMMEWSQLSRDEKAKWQLPDYQFWTEEELATLEKYWAGGKSPAECLEALPGRSYAAITKVASEAGIRRPPGYRKKRREARV